jgi:hypothetical protein
MRRKERSSVQQKRVTQTKNSKILEIFLLKEKNAGEKNQQKLNFWHYPSPVRTSLIFIYAA